MMLIFPMKKVMKTLITQTIYAKFVASLRDKLGNKIITYTQTSESPEGITNDANLKLGRTCRLCLV